MPAGPRDGRTERLTVFGTGYLGTVHAACMAEAGFRVLGVDADPARIDALRAGRPGIHEPGLGAMLRRGLAEGRLAFTTSYAEAAAFGDVHFVCVGTPERAGGAGGAELSQLEACLEALAPLLRRPCLVVGKSTVPPGTAARLARERLPAVAELAWNPEFLREGHAVADTLRPDRIVAGVQSRRAEAVLRRVYAGQLKAGVPFVVTDLATAELVKLAANAFLATKISFINAMAEICEVAGGDAALLATALGYDPRIGGTGLRPGIGFGGGCLPKDTRIFGQMADELGVTGAASLLRMVDVINRQQRERMVELAAELAGGSLAGARVGVLGLAFKPGTDDVRDSPAMAVAAAIADMGATVTAFDPAAMDRARAQCPQLRYARSPAAAARGADVLLLLTEWPQFTSADPAELAAVVAQRNVADGRHALDQSRWQAAGWRYRALGQGGMGGWVIPPCGGVTGGFPPGGKHSDNRASQRSMQASRSSVSTGLVT
jgi:UDPglucose 6-dehydrogenase